jgi:hypothetical protein
VIDYEWEIGAEGDEGKRRGQAHFINDPNRKKAKTLRRSAKSRLQLRLSWTRAIADSLLFSEVLLVYYPQPPYD